MKYIRISIIAAWSVPFLLLVWPGHTLAHELKLPEMMLALGLVVFICSAIGKGRQQITGSLFENKVIRTAHVLIALVLLAATAATYFMLIADGGSIRENREVFEQNYRAYNYLFVMFSFSAIMLSLSRFVARKYVYLARATWLLMGILLLTTGNRQFAFFSLIFLFFYNVGTSINAGRMFVRAAGLGIVVMVAAILFSIQRLDYLHASEALVFNAHLSRLTGATCSLSDFCESWFETTFQLLYAYLGMNYSGMSYAIEYHGRTGGFPFLSSIAPVLYRRLEVDAPTNDFWKHVDNFDHLIVSSSGVDFSHFFISMFGGVALESGLVGILAFSLIAFAAIRISGQLARVSGNESVYMMLIFLCVLMIFGFMQFPFAEPFVFFALLNVFAHQLVLLGARAKASSRPRSPLAV